MSIALRGITKSFQGVTVIPPLTIEFSSRAFTTLLGPSGCGKTTLLRMIAGLETPDAGEILFDGKPDEATRSALKQNGFRWSPRNSAWQRQLTDNAERAARRALGLV